MKRDFFIFVLLAVACCTIESEGVALLIPVLSTLVAFILALTNVGKEKKKPVYDVDTFLDYSTRSDMWNDCR